MVWGSGQGRRGGAESGSEHGWEGSLGARGVLGGTVLEAKTRGHTLGLPKGKGAESLTWASVLAGYVLSAPGPGETCRQHPGTGTSTRAPGTTASFQPQWPS